MTDHEILSAISRVAEQHLRRRGALRGEMRLVEDLGLDSLQLLTLAVEVENHFRIRLDDGGIVTVSDLVTTVRRQLAD